MLLIRFPELFSLLPSSGLGISGSVLGGPREPTEDAAETPKGLWSQQELGDTQ